MAGSSDCRPRVAVRALGCRVSQAEADALARALGEAAVAPDGQPLDVVVVNTCTVTADAARAARQAIRRAGRENPGARIVAAGCHAQTGAAELSRLPGVVAVVGARDAARLEEVVRRVMSLPSSTATAATPTSSPARHARAILKVQDGCDARCSYCIVPHARGPSRSLPFADALAQLEALGRRSNEVVLAGVHLGGYGRDLDPRRTLSELVLAAAERRAVARLRLSSIEPPEVPLDAIAAAPGFLCEHFHVALQSGSDRVLAAMRRPYRAAEGGRAIERLAAVPGACIGADLMAGFPGETDADHRATVRLLEALPLAYAHVFAYSPRPGTDAARLPRVPRDVVRERAAELRRVAARRWEAFLRGLQGREVEVVVESVVDGMASGTSREYATVSWPEPGHARGDLVRVRITAREGDGLSGRREPPAPGTTPTGAATTARP